MSKTKEAKMEAKPEKLSTKNYNVTDLDPKTAFERHVYHRDQFAHYLRWTHILKCMKINDAVLDFGCGNGNLLEVLYRNRFKASRYIGIDIRKKTIEEAQHKFEIVDWAEWHVMDLVKAPIKKFEELSTLANGKKPKHIASFEVLEHVGKINGKAFMDRFAACGDENSVFYLSTPNYDEHVGAAGNHTYDSGDGKGVQPQEFTHEEIEKLIKPKFEIIEKFGTFASQKDYKPFLTAAQKQMYNDLSKYYDSNLVAVLFAPLFPEKSRNTLWKLKLKQ